MGRAAGIGIGCGLVAALACMVFWGQPGMFLEAFAPLLWIGAGTWAIVHLLILYWRLQEPRTPEPLTARKAPAPIKAPPPSVPTPGTYLRRVGRYGLVEELGHGAFGTVYKAVDITQPDRFWALKETSMKVQDSASEETLRSIFDKEQKILSWLNHPNIVARRDFFTADYSLFLVMEYVEGYTLRQVLSANRGAFLQEFVAGVAEEICAAIAYLHSQRPNPIIFRDLKPGNVMLAQDGGLKLIDFGICRLSNQQETATTLELVNQDAGAEEVTAVLGHCRDTLCLGTPGYAAPEQYPDSGLQTDPRCDVFALGVLMWELLTDERPPREPASLAGIKSYNATAHDELEAIVQRATALDREQRYSSAKLMGKALSDFRQKRLGMTLDELRQRRILVFGRTANYLKHHCV